MKTVRTIPGQPDRVIMPDGRREVASVAKAQGYTVVTEQDQARTRANLEELVADRHETPAARAAARRDLDLLDRADYAHAIRCLPEAEDREAAAGRVIAAHTARSMPPERAAIFLRNLPYERPARAAPSTTPRHVEPPSVPLKRKAELAMAQAQARARLGDPVAERRMKGLASALALHANHGTDMERALSISGINAASL